MSFKQQNVSDMLEDKDKSKRDMMATSVMTGEPDVVKVNWINLLDIEFQNCEFGCYTHFCFV